MASFVCLHGAGGRASHWSPLADELAALGHEVVAMDLPCEEEVGLAAHVEVVVDAVDAAGARDGALAVVAHSLAGFVGPLACAELPVELLVLVAAMVPLPGERGADWWGATGHEAALLAQGLPDHSPEVVFVHDVPPEVLAAAGPPRSQSAEPLEEPWPLPAWPDVPTRAVLYRDDRFFPRDWLAGVVRDRLGIEPLEVPGGHVAHLSQPRALAALLDRCWRERGAGVARP